MTTYWLNYPPVLLSNIFNVNPFNCNNDRAERFNALARVIIIATITLLCIPKFKSKNTGLAGLLSICITVILFNSGGGDGNTNENAEKEKLIKAKEEKGFPAIPLADPMQNPTKALNKTLEQANGVITLDDKMQKVSTKILPGSTLKRTIQNNFNGWVENKKDVYARKGTAGNGAVERLQKSQNLRDFDPKFK